MQKVINSYELKYCECNINNINVQKGTWIFAYSFSHVDKTFKHKYFYVILINDIKKIEYGMLSSQ